MESSRIPILVGDGGGIRALWQMVFYREISKLLQAPLSQIFKHGLIAGVSGGGINAGALVHPRGITPEETIQFYIDEGPKIFHRSWYEPPPLFDPKFDNNNLAQILQAHYGDDLLRKALCPVYIPAWDLSSNEPREFTEQDYSPIWMACRATAAVPSAFATWGNWVDGGVYGSNPTLWTLARARELYGMRARFVIVSVGTGSHRTVVNAKALHQAGQAGWLLPIIETLADAGPIVTELKMPLLVGPDDLYFRWQAPIVEGGPSPEMDDGSTGNTAKLIKFQEEQIAGRQSELIAICEALAGCQ